MLQSPLAYKFVLIMAMIAQVNYYAPRMGLPFSVPVQRQEIHVLEVGPPIANNRFQVYGGRLQVDNYAFIFFNNALAIQNLDKYGYISFGIPMGPKETAKSGMERASRMKYIVNTNDIYLMASNWIGALDINLEMIEKTHQVYVNEHPLFHSSRGWVPNPILTVDWKNTNDPEYFDREVTLDISAVSGELLSLRVGGGASSSRRPLVNHLPDLLAISDEEFLKYSPLERSNLVFQFTGMHDDKAASFPLDMITNDIGVPQHPPVSFSKPPIN